MFGASIYVADLVGISMTREMGSLMTGIIMAGRTGAAYAAQIGAMKRSEELDALRTMGLSPITMVVLPKTLALTTMTPLLSIFSTFVGMFAGLTVANSVLDISVFQYINETAHSVPLHDLIIGVLKSVVYGFLVAFAGAWRGSRCGNSADAVGKAATSAVVLSLTLIVVADGLFAVLLNALKL
jgi:phospholipid/cholesterol/gamma-HCH transport system permease protein